MINTAMAFCHRRNIKVYPVYNYGWYIKTEINGKPKRFDKKINAKEINEAVTKTYIHLYKKFT